MKEWKDKAKRNIKKWGLQSEETLLLAMMEELGELTQAFLKYKHTDPIEPDETDIQIKLNRIKSELSDLMALGYQLEAQLEVVDDFVKGSEK